MEDFESALSQATDPVEGHLLGAVAMVIDSNGMSYPRRTAVPVQQADNPLGNFLYRRAAGRQRLDLDSPPLDPDCTISLASAAKFFTDVAALQLVERGLIGLDDPLKTHIPQLEKCWVVEKGQDGAVVVRPPARDITLRDVLINTSGIGTHESYEEILGKDAHVAPLAFPDGTHFLVKKMATHLFFEPGQGFYYGNSVYMVQLLVELLGGERTYVAYANKHLFGVLGMTSTTYLPAKTPHVWERRLQVVGREGAALVPRDDVTYGITCSVSDLATFFSDLLSPDCRLLHDPKHRDMLFTPQLALGSPAQQMLVADSSNYGFVMPMAEGVDPEVSWAVSPPPRVNWTVTGALLEEDDTLPNTGYPAGTVTFEGLPNVIWTMNRERGRMMLFGNQLMPAWDVRAHNLAVQFLRDAWKTFG